MTYVITFPCIGVKDASCVDACPVNYIHPTPDEPGFEEAEHLHIRAEKTNKGLLWHSKQILIDSCKA